MVSTVFSYQAVHFPSAGTPLIRILILSIGDLCAVALPNCGSKWMTTVLVQFSGAWLVSSRMFPNFGFAL
jgi:hypothetical protein